MGRRGRDARVPADGKVPAASPPSPAQPAPRPPVGFGLAVALAIAVFVAFGGALTHGFVNWDDLATLVENDRYRGFGGEALRWMFTTFHMGHWQPLTWLSWSLDWTLAGLDPARFHLTSVVLHVFNVLLVFLLARKVLDLLRPAGSPPDEAAPRTAALAAFLFGIHPMKAESVAWVTERRDLLCAFFLIASVLAYLPRQRGTAPSAGRLAGSLALFALSLGSKASGVVLPAILLLVDAALLDRLRSGVSPRAIGRLLAEKAAFAALALPVALVAIRAVGASGATAGWVDRSLGDRLLQAAYGLSFYLAKTVVPTGLSPLYELERGRTVVPAGSWALLAVLAAGLAFAARRRPRVVAAFAAWGLLLAPILGLFQSGPQKVADRYSYLPSIPLALLVAAAVGPFLFRNAEETRRLPEFARRGALVGLGIALVALLATTQAQVAIWRDSFSLWNRALLVNPASAGAHYGLGIAHRLAGDRDRARSAFSAALASDPLHLESRAELGILQVEAGETDAGEANLRRVLESFPSHARALFSLGIAREARGDLPGAEATLSRAIVADASLGQAWNNRGTIRGRLGRSEEAIADLRQAAALLPGDAAVQANLAASLAAAGRRDEALAAVETALRLAPAGLRAPISGLREQIVAMPPRPGAPPPGGRSGDATAPPRR